MGGSHSMDKTLKKNQEIIAEINRMKMERIIHMNCQLKEREKALEIARNRELFFWVFGFYSVAATGIFSRYIQNKRPAVLTPLIPITFVMAYVADMGYGSKVHRIHAEAEMILEHEHELVALPGGIPTLSEIDASRIEVDEERRMHPIHN